MRRFNWLLILAILGLCLVPSIAFAKTKYVGLSFDDGPTVNTIPVAKILKRNGVRCTWFFVGNRIPSNVDTRTILSAGDVGNHTYDHVEMATMTVAQARSEISSGGVCIQNVFGFYPHLFRSRGLCYTVNVKTAIALEQVRFAGGVLVQDYGTAKSNNANDIYKRAIKRATNGKILVLHDRNNATLKALPKILKWYRQHKIKVVTVSKLQSIQKR